jgi:uncharacterized membrane protein
MNASWRWRPRWAFVARTNRGELLVVLLVGLSAVLSLAGMAVSAYLTYGYFADNSLYCELGGGCDAVMESQYSAVLGVPQSVLGLLMYVAILAAALASVSRRTSLRELSSIGVFGMALAGTVYSGYLAWLELYRVEAVCMWCTISALLLTGILIVSAVDLTLRFRWRAEADPG